MTDKTAQTSGTPRYEIVDARTIRIYGQLFGTNEPVIKLIAILEKELTAAQSALAEAEADAKHVRQANANYRRENQLAVERADQAEARARAAEKDAERYRWLRDEKNLDAAGNIFDDKWGEELDKALDTERVKNG